MRVLITGATGFIGSHVAHVLIAMGCDVIVSARSNRKLTDLFPGCQVAELDFTASPDAAIAALVELLDQVDIVINTVGIIAEKGKQTFQQIHVEFPRCLFQASAIASVRRFIQISAIGAEAGARTGYHRSKHQADTLLRTFNMECAIVKPSLVYGGEGASSTFFSALAAQPLHPLVGGGRQQVQPIHIDDLAEAVARLGLMEFPPDEMDAVGPEPMSFRQMLAGYRQWLGYGSLRAFPVPSGLVLAVSRLTGLFSGLLRRDNILMLLQGNTGDPATISRVLGHAPRPFDQALRQMPAQAQRWQARLYFLVPALRMAVAFVWIFTGIVSAFLYPAEESLALLAEVGLHGPIALNALYAAAGLDIAIGIAVLLRYRTILTGLLQLAVMGTYTVLISRYLPEYWLHPYGPISKNIPFLVAVLILMAVSDKRRE